MLILTHTYICNIEQYKLALTHTRSPTNGWVTVQHCTLALDRREYSILF